MWNRRIILIFIVAVVLIALITKILMSYLYEGFIFEDIVQAGANGKVCYYTVQIDPDLDVKNFSNQTPKMGIALDWADKQNAVVNVNLYELMDNKPVLVEKWREKEGMQRGVLTVNPGQKFRLEVLAVKGETSFTLKLFKPSDAYSSVDTDNGNAVGSLVFYRISESKANTIYTFCSQLLGVDSTSGQEGIHIFTGSENQFMQEFSLNDTIELKELAIDNLIILQKDYSYMQSLTVENYYAINDQNNHIEPVNIAGKFSDPITINNGETFEFSKVRFDEKSKYLLLMNPEQGEADFQIRLYAEGDTGHTNCLRKSSRLESNFNLLLLNDLDKSKEYCLLVTAQSMKKKSASFIMTLMGNGELKKPDLEFQSVESVPFRLVNGSNTTEVLWYVFRPKEIGQHEIMLSWKFNETGIITPQSALPHNTKAVLFENGIGIRSKDISNIAGFLNFTFESTQSNTTYFLKIVASSLVSYSLETKGLYPTTVSVMGDPEYNEGMFDLLLNLLTTAEIDVEYFSNWYKLLLGAQGVKYKLIGVLVNKVTSGDITPATLQDEYNRLNAVTDWSTKSVIEQLILMHENNLLTVEEFVKGYRSILNSQEDIQKILESTMVDLYEDGFIEWATFKEWSAKYVLVNFSVYNEQGAELLEYMLQKDLLSWSQFEKLEYIAESKHNIQMVINLLDSRVLDLDTFKKTCLRELQNVPEWFEKLCDWGTSLNNNSKILTEGDVDTMFAEKKESELSNVQSFLKILNFYLSDVDGQIGDKSRIALKEFKSFFNYYYSGTDLTIDYSIDYNVVLAMALVFVDQVKILRVDQLPYWYKNLYDWRDKILSKVEVPASFAKDQVSSRIWCLETAFNRLGKQININGKNDDILKEFIIEYKETDTTDKVDDQLLTRLMNELYEEAVIEMIDTKRVKQYATFTWPVDSLNVTSGFGYRLHPTRGVWDGHYGLDIGALTPGVEGDEIRPILKGEVENLVNTLSNKGSGTFVELQHGSRIKSRYLHMQYNSLQLELSEIVNINDTIGFMGKTGGVDGVHLHLDVKFFDGYEYRYIDPILLFDFATLH